MRPLNRNEVLVGAVFGWAMIFFIGFWALPLGLVTGLLWAIGGAGYGKGWRRFGVPAVAALFWMLSGLPILHSAATIPGAIAILSIGYGIPSTQPPDEGSALGRFWYRIAQKLLLRGEGMIHVVTLHNKAAALAVTLTRGTLYVGLALNYIAISRL